MLRHPSSWHYLHFAIQMSLALGVLVAYDAAEQLASRVIGRLWK